MTKFRSKALLLALAVLVSGCAGQQRYGTPAPGLRDAVVAYGYIPLKRPSYIRSETDGGAVVLGRGIAVTVAHNDNLLDPKRVIGRSIDYDLLFFRTDRDRAVFVSGEPSLGETVVSYAHYEDDLYTARGPVTQIDAPVKPECAKCAVQGAFVFEADAGPGYSGGPVLDAASGKLVGIVFGYQDRPGGNRLIYGYSMARVWAELERLTGPAGLMLAPRKD